MIEGLLEGVVGANVRTSYTIHHGEMVINSCSNKKKKRFQIIFQIMNNLLRWPFLSWKVPNVFERVFVSV